MSRLQAFNKTSNFFDFMKCFAQTSFGGNLFVRRNLVKKTGPLGVFMGFQQKEIELKHYLWAMRKIIGLMFWQFRDFSYLCKSFF